MTDPRLDEVRRLLSVPVAPRDAFAHSLLERLEAELAGDAMSAAELAAENAEELPMREAMTVIAPDPFTPLDPGCDLPIDPVPLPEQPI